MRQLYRFWGYLIWVPKFKKGRKRKSNFLHEIEKLPSLTLFSKLNIESELINAVNRTKNYHITLVFPCFRQYFNKKVGTSCPELKTILKILPLGANHIGALDWPTTWHNSTDAQIRGLDQPLRKWHILLLRL